MKDQQAPPRGDPAIVERLFGLLENLLRSVPKGQFNCV